MVFVKHHKSSWFSHKTASWGEYEMGRTEPSQRHSINFSNFPQFFFE